MKENYTRDESTCDYIPKLTPTENFTFTTTTGSTSPTASLSIDNKDSVSSSVNASYGTVAYSSHTVTVNVTEAASYSLILSGPTNLTGPSTIGSATGVLGKNLANDTWGYAWENTNIADENATYKAVSSSVNLTGPDLNNKATSFSRKLAFAAKFQNAATGTYHADITLSLVATPEVTTQTINATNAVPWDKLVYMQDMTSYACMQANDGDSKTLKDIRDNNTYTIKKIGDKCWMAQNLRLIGGKMLSGYNYVTKYDSNVASTSSVPTSALWSSTSSTVQGAYYNNDTTYGAYYSWCTAAAGTCSSAATNGAEVSYDICPKGWQLPSGKPGIGTNDFAVAAGLTSTNITAGNSNFWNSLSNPSFTSSTLTVNGTSWIAAGRIYRGSLDNTGTISYYWSRTANSSSATYVLYFDTSVFYPSNYSPRYYGYSIRCIAK